MGVGTGVVVTAPPLVFVLVGTPTWTLMRLPPFVAGGVGTTLGGSTAGTGTGS